MATPDAGIYILLAVLLALSAFFSASETALSSVNKIRLKNMAEDGVKHAKTAISLSDDFDRTLSAILIGNNVVNNASASLATIVATAILGSSGAVIATTVITILVLIFGEILPKSFAKENSESVTLATAVPLRVIKTLLTPVVWVFVLIKRLFTGRRSDELNIQPSVTEEELKTIIDTVEEEGVLDSQETEIIQSAIEFDNISVQDILVPRVDMVAAEVNTPVDELLAMCIENGISRIPVYDGTIDNVVGVLHAKDMLACLAKGQEIVPKTLMREILVVFRSKKISSLLAEFRRQKQHMAVVTDEHGGTVGLVTMEDVLEELVGEIWDESDTAETPVQKQPDGSWLVDGDVRTEDFFEIIGFEDKDFDCDYTTVGGWVLDVMEHIPSVGEGFKYKTLDVTITHMDEKRIGKIAVRSVEENQK
ncbi:MAG: HlyC/CorC family transporter [Clostridia bacterium]|nr:HlyC/CorC family transporter [Clostridia bacterium]